MFRALIILPLSILPLIILQTDAGDVLNKRHSPKRWDR